MFWRRRPQDPGPIILLEPAGGALTEPLQQYRLPDRDDLDGLGGASDVAADWLHPRILNPDRSFPSPVTFRWLPPPRLRQRTRYDLHLDRDPAMRSPILFQGIPQPAIRLRHLLVDTDYFWQVTATLGGDPLAASAIGHFRTHPALPRWLRVPEMTNVRDLGGWPAGDGMRVRQGMLYRSSEMNRHLSLTSEGAQVLLGELGIRTDIDLRAESESPSPALPEDQVRWVHCPILPYDRVASPEVMQSLRLVFSLLADPAVYPAIIHCWAGADRAGTVAALLLAALGVGHESIATDYELSSLSVWGQRSRDSRDFAALLAVLRSFAPPGQDGIAAATEAFLGAAGVAAAELDAVRGLLLEPLPPPMAAQDPDRPQTLRPRAF